MEMLGITTDQAVLRLIVALMLGVVLGFERVWAHKTAGPRTYGMVALGSALFVLVSEMVSHTYLQSGVQALDVVRMAGQVVIGVGFLGAGLIVFRGNQVVNLTTASGIWVAAGIGIAAGFGLYGLAVAATALALFTFTILWFIEDRFKQLREESNADEYDVG